jgi:hypothetical protein
MLRWVPKEIQNEYGTAKSSLLNGNCLSFDPDQEVEIIRVFGRFGYECVKDEVLVNDASGYESSHQGSGDS